MFDIGWQEIFIIGLLAMIVVGPRDLPRAIKTISMWIKKARGLAREFQSGIDEVTREIELDDLKKSVMDGGDFDLAKEIENSIDPTGEMMSDKDLKELENTFYDSSGKADAGTAKSGEAQTNDAGGEMNPREKALAAVSGDVSDSTDPQPEKAKQKNTDPE